MTNDRRAPSGRNMTGNQDRTATVPPRVFVRSAWVLHRALLRFSKHRPPDPARPHRVKSHVHSISGTLGAANRVEAIARAIDAIGLAG